VFCVLEACLAAQSRDEQTSRAANETALEQHSPVAIALNFLRLGNFPYYPNGVEQRV
jgi:hypothetical protein